MADLNQRQLFILKKIIGKPFCTSSVLGEYCGVSRETIRKELLVLEKAHLINRNMGKISYIENPKNTSVIEAAGILSKDQRRNRIIELLRQDSHLRISTLSHKLKVSTITIRNDIAALELEGSVIRKHGEVTLFEPLNSEQFDDSKENFHTKTKILGQHTIMHITPGETIFLDAGEISRYVATHLPPYSNIPIVTNSFEILIILYNRQYRYPVYIYGTFASIHNGRFHNNHLNPICTTPQIDKAFICCSSYKNNTFYLDDKEELSTIDAVCQNATKVYLIIDSRYVDIEGTKIFTYQSTFKKLQEVAIDDGLGSFRTSILFSHHIPLVICGQDYTYRNVSKQQYRIGFLVNKDHNYFIQAVHNSLLEATSKTQSISLVIRECEGNYTSTVNNLNALLEEHVDLIIDYSLCMESLIYVGEKCLSRNIKLISVDYMAPGAIYFGADNALAGKIAGQKAVQYINNNWNKKVDHVVVLGKYGHEVIAKLRISGALEHINQSLTLNKESFHTIEWGNPISNPTQELITLLKEIPQHESMLIIAFNLRHLLSTYNIILEYRSSENTIIVGQNHTKQIEELMKIGNSPIIGCVHYNPQTYGEKIIDLAMRMLNNIEVPPRNYTTLSWIKKN